jgi:glycerol-3-phosphate dehydrogenase
LSVADFDLTVIGGGIHGVGVAQCAAAAGHRVCLLESRQLASGTSSKSSKLIHGGLRYLESFELGLVRESLRERATLLRNAPQLVREVPFFIPIYGETSRRPWQIRVGLSMYRLLAGSDPLGKFRSVPRAEWIDLDGLKTEGLQAVFQYFDAQTDDAQLTRAVMDSAIELGAQLVQPAELLEATRQSSGYSLRYRCNQEEREHTTTVLVNAGGPWVEAIRARIHPTPPGFDIDLVGGTHIELPGTVNEGIYYTEAPADGRAVFTMPWKGHTLVGTTERLYKGDPREIAPTEAEVEYLLDTYGHHFPTGDKTLLNSWAGLRVLPSASGSAFKRTRETVYRTDDGERPNYLGIYGGKLTGYRATAEVVLNRLHDSLPQREALARTDQLPLTAPSFADGDSKTSSPS